MLKWTVNKRAEPSVSDSMALALEQSSGNTFGGGRRSLGTIQRPLRNRDRLELRRKSLGSSELSKRIHNRNKENQHVATPHPYNFRSTVTSTPSHSTKFEFALRDVRNLTPSNGATPNTTPSRKRPLPKTPPTSPSQMSPERKLACATPSLYASTLPTFDLEYSPCGITIEPTPMRAMRSAITETYFKNPRYLHNDEEDMPIQPVSKKLKYSPPAEIRPPSTRLSDMRFNKISMKRNSSRLKKFHRPKNENNNHISNNHLASSVLHSEESLSSSAMDDTALDRLLDAILESGKKEKTSFVRSLTLRKSNNSNKAFNPNFGSPTYTAAEDPASDLNLFCDKFLVSPEKMICAAERTIIIDDMEVVNEREVRTPEVIDKPDIVESAKQPNIANDGSCHLRRQKGVRRKHTKAESLQIRKALSSVTGPSTTKEQIETTSPVTPTETDLFLTSFFKKSIDELACMNTPTPMEAMSKDTSSNVVPQCAITSITSKMSYESTPGINSTDLQASSTPTGAQAASIRRCLNFSDSPPESIDNDSLEKRKSTTSSIVSSTSSRCFQTTTATGSLDVAIFEENKILNVHVIRCRDLARQFGGQINAYVKIALLATDLNIIGSYQRTAVHRNSIRPFFDHRFAFDVNDIKEGMRIQLAVWHRDREFKRSEFLGCMSFPVKDVLNKEVTGSFKLQPQTSLTTPTQPVAMCENSQSSVDDVISTDDAVGAGSSADQYSDAQIPLSKKAIHQRDADENLFLRFLELDPPEVPEPRTPASDPRRKSTQKSSQITPAPSVASSNPSQGRTPFTITKKLIRTADRGFGFSIVWTHPPRIEKVEPGLSADKCEIFPGDYVIFVDKHNVVTMPEMDILNLIKSQGNSLVLEIFRRSKGTSARPTTNGIKSRIPSLVATGSQIDDIQQTPKRVSIANVSGTSSVNVTTVAPPPPRPSTACSNVSFSMEATKRRLHLPQVTFSKESILPLSMSGEDIPRKYLYQLINREQHFVTALQFGIQRFTSALQERHDLISATDHRTLFQNIEEILRLSEDILEQIMSDDQEPQVQFSSRIYLSKSTTFCAAYKKYCNGLKRADCVLVNKSRHSNSEFVTFITVPQVPRKRPDLTTFIHRPLQHFREVLKLIILLASNCRPDSEECRSFTTVIAALQTSYREITVSEGIMEPLVEGRPLLTLQDLESRLVFTKCKPFVLTVPGRQWIFGGDLSRVEGRSVKPYWTLLFSDLLLFAKVSRDRVLFITEEPIPLANITDTLFNIRKKSTEFRITIDPNGRLAESPTAHCAPDLTRTPRKNARKRIIILRTPTPELKAVWQNLLLRQVLLVNATLSSTLSSPLESPDILQTFLPLCDIGAATTSMASIKLSADSINNKSQQSKESRDSSCQQIDELIDEKCRSLNKSGTSRGSAIHLAQWMKGQFDDSVKKLTESRFDSTDLTSEEDLIEDWSQDQLRKRSQELQLIDENGKCISPRLDNGRRSATSTNKATDECHDVDDGSKSASTTSDSQITVKSSPLNTAGDKISVCRHCHKNCKQKVSHSISNSLKVQHSQSSSIRCCQSISSQESQSNQNSPKSTPTTKSTDIRTSQISLNTSKTSVSLSKADQNCNHIEYRVNHVIVQDTVNSSPKINHASNCNTPCKCKCKPENFRSTIRQSQEVRKETCKLVNSVAELQRVSTTPKISSNISHLNCRCVCDNKPMTNTIKETKISNDNDDDTDDWCSLLIGLSQFHPAANLVKVDPFEAVPKIAIVPPTPEGNLSKSGTMLWDNLNRVDSNCGVVNHAADFSPDDSPQDEEPPYRSLKRFGTMSSLERIPSEETDDLTYNSSGAEDDDNGDIKVVTKEIFDPNEPPIRNWTNRAGSFLEQSRAFLDSYLGRWDRSNDDEDIVEENAEECTSGATSGEEVWGTPTSGDIDEMHGFHSDQAQSSPTKSSSSLTGDDDTELMMDELLMAPPMTASTIRGLLPRRRLEPLFEEDTETSSDSDSNDDEDKLPPDCSSSDQGQVSRALRTNGHDTATTSESSTLPTSDIRVEITSHPIASMAAVNFGHVADIGYTPAPTLPPQQPPNASDANTIGSTVGAGEPSNVPVARLSPRLEMRLALNHDILGDEDLIGFDPGPKNLAAILGRDLSSYHRFTGRDLISRSASRVVPKEAIISYSQQRNSKMDTPIPNRKKSNQNTWNNSASVDRSTEKKLSDLERLARQEKMYCASQLKNGQAGAPSIKLLKNPDASNDIKPNKFLNFFRRNSDNQLSKHSSKESLSTNSSAGSDQTFIASKDGDKPLDRRFWKQLNKRRRSISGSEISAMN